VQTVQPDATLNLVLDAADLSHDQGLTFSQKTTRENGSVMRARIGAWMKRA
jgi:hypothetical protein